MSQPYRENVVVDVTVTTAEDVMTIAKARLLDEIREGLHAANAMNEHDGPTAYEQRLDALRRLYESIIR